MKTLRLVFVALLTGLLAAPASAQSLSLDQLLKLSALPPGLPLEKMTAALFSSEWSYGGRVGQTEETYWTAGQADADSVAGSDKAISRVSLRPMATGSVDVLFKTRQGRNFEPIRRELKHQKLPVTPVTCLDCKGDKYEGQYGEQYTGPNYTITLYTGKKAPYSFVIVLHQDASPSGAKPATPATSTATLAGQTANP